MVFVIGLCNSLQHGMSGVVILRRCRRKSCGHGRKVVTGCISGKKGTAPGRIAYGCPLVTIFPFGFGVFDR